MKFTLKQFAELPFVLNIPSEVYPIHVDGVNVSVRVHHNLYAGAQGAIEYPVPVWIGEKKALTASLSSNTTYSLLQLHTVVSSEKETDFDVSELCSPTPNELIDEYARKLILDRSSDNAGGALLAEAQQQLDTLGPAQVESFRKFTALRLTAKKLYPHSESELFLRAVNQLIRTYMADIGDFFVEEVTLHQVAGTTPRGILRISECDGQLVETFTVLDKIPPAMRQPWFVHPADKIAVMKAHLNSGVEPDAVDLLGTRARGLLERGAYRSAIIESGAAMETAVARRIINGMIASGKTHAEALQLLHNNQKFSDRCKGILKDVTSKSIPDLDNKLWERVVLHRDTYRHKIAHSDQEPMKKDAEKVVTDFLALAKLVTAFTS